MKNEAQSISLETPKQIVLVERQLQSEFSLLEKLDDLNQTLKTALEESGTRGLSPEQTGLLDQKVSVISVQSREAKLKRQKLLSTINSNRDASLPPLSIRQFIQTLDASSMQRLEKVRIELLDRLHEAHTNLIGNQAVMFYSYEFYKRMVSGLLNSDIEANQYSMSGQSATVKPGDLFRKAI